MSIIGHQTQINMLLSAVQMDRVHSSYLFVGQSGVGKKLVATEFAKMLNCHDKDVAKKPCGECSSCRKIELGTHPDVITIVREEEKTSIAIDQLRAMAKGLQFRPVMGGYNVRIIDDAHLMHNEAANSILKILEEPPENTVIILITPVPRSLPTTIISRCAVIRFGILSDQEIKNKIGKYNLSSDEYNFITSVAMGSLGKAVWLAENGEIVSEYRNIISDFENGQFANKRFDRQTAADFLDVMISRVRVEKPEKLELVLKMKNYISRNASIGLVMDVLRVGLVCEE